MESLTQANINEDVVASLVQKDSAEHLQRVEEDILLLEMVQTALGKVSI